MEENVIIYPQIIKGVSCVESEFSGTIRSYHQITLVLESQKIDFYPINDTDEINTEISRIDTLSDISSTKSHLNYLVGKKIFITWKCINSQGYYDLFIIGLNTIQPTFCILSEGSSLKILEFKKE